MDTVEIKMLTLSVALHFNTDENALEYCQMAPEIPLVH